MSHSFKQPSNVNRVNKLLITVALEAPPPSGATWLHLALSVFLTARIRFGPVLELATLTADQGIAPRNLEV